MRYLFLYESEAIRNCSCSDTERQTIKDSYEMTLQLQFVVCHVCKEKWHVQFSRTSIFKKYFLS